MMETIAVYHERPIKTYGIDVEPGLCLLSATVAQGELPALGRGVFSPAALSGPVKMVAATPVGGSRVLAQCVTTVPPETAAGLTVTRDVELVSLHGPHYGDRYGIALAALSALADHDVPVLSSACGGASITIVVPCGRGTDAREALSTAFVVPSAESEPAP